LKQKFAALPDAALLTQAPLIHVTSVSADWEHWFRASGMEIPDSIDRGLTVDTVQMASDAAIRGFGVALGRRPLVDEDIASGRLVPLAAQTIPSGSGYWLVTAQAEFQKPEVKLFRRWLTAELSTDTEQRKPA